MALTRPSAAQINTSTLDITDPLFRINKGQSGANDKDIGLVLERGSDTNVAFIWDESANQFVLINTTETGSTSGNVTISSYAGLQANAIVYGSLNDGTTTLTATAAELNYVDGVTSNIQTQIDNISSSFTLAADSGSNDTFTTGQTLTFTGGTGIDTTVSDNTITYAIDSTVATLTGTQTITNKTIDSASNTLTLDLSEGTLTGTTSEFNSALSDGSFTTLAGAETLTNKTLTNPTINAFSGTGNGSITGTLTVSGAVNFDDTTGSTSTTTGALIVDGGVGIAENLYVGGTIDMDRLSLTSSQTTVPPLQLTANSLTDGVGALRIDGSQADIFLNPSTATHTTVTFAVNNDQRLAFGMDNNSDFYITRRTGGSWYDNTFVIDRDTGLLSLGYGATVTGTLTYSTLNDGTTTLTSTVAELNILDGVTSTATELNLLDGVTGTLVTEAGTQTLTNKTLTSPQVTTDIRLNAQAELEFYDSDSSHYVSFRAPSTVASSVTWTLPASDGTADQVLATNGAGTLSWADASAGGGSGSSYPNSTFQTVPGTDGNFDLSYNVAQTTQETPFEASGTDAFGVNLGSVFDSMDPVGTLESLDYGDGEAYVGA